MFNFSAPMSQIKLNDTFLGAMVCDCLKLIEEIVC